MNTLYPESLNLRLCIQHFVKIITYFGSIIHYFLIFMFNYAIWDDDLFIIP